MMRERSLSQPPQEGSGPRRKPTAEERISSEVKPRSGVVRGRYILKSPEQMIQEKKTEVIPPPLPAKRKEPVYRGKMKMEPTAEEKRKKFIEEHYRLPTRKTHLSSEEKARLSPYFEDELPGMELGPVTSPHRDVISDKFLRKLEGLTPAQQQMKIDQWYERFENAKTRAEKAANTPSEEAAMNDPVKRRVDVKSEIAKIREEIARTRGMENEDVHLSPDDLEEDIPEQGPKVIELNQRKNPPVEKTGLDKVKRLLKGIFGSIWPGKKAA